MRCSSRMTGRRGMGCTWRMGCGISCRMIRRFWTAPSRGWGFCGRRRRRGRGRCMRMRECFRGGLASRRVRRFLREDGTQRVTSTIYSPVCGGGRGQRLIRRRAIRLRRRRRSIVCASMRQGIGNLTWQAENVGGTRALPAGFNLVAGLLRGPDLELYAVEEYQLAAE